MAKTRRTRKEKVRSSLRQTATTETPTQSTQRFSYSLPLHAKPTASSSVGMSHSYVASDLGKTLFITTTIILAQVILFVLLQYR